MIVTSIYSDLLAGQQIVESAFGALGFYNYAGWQGRFAGIDNYRRCKPPLDHAQLPSIAISINCQGHQQVYPLML